MYVGWSAPSISTADFHAAHSFLAAPYVDQHGRHCYGARPRIARHEQFLEFCLLTKEDPRTPVRFFAGAQEKPVMAQVRYLFEAAIKGTATSTSCWTRSHVFHSSTPPHTHSTPPHTHAVRCALLSAHAHRMLLLLATRCYAHHTTQPLQAPAVTAHRCGLSIPISRPRRATTPGPTPCTGVQSGHSTTRRISSRSTSSTSSTPRAIDDAREKNKRKNETTRKKQ